MNLLENLAENGLDSFSANDILIVAVIESLLQADFLPCFEVDISSILQKNVGFMYIHMYSHIRPYKCLCIYIYVNMLLFIHQ
jgi:hypothetical protein